MTIIEMKAGNTPCKWCALSPCHCAENLIWPSVPSPSTTAPPHNCEAEVLVAQERYRSYYEARMAEDVAFREEVAYYNRL